MEIQPFSATSTTPPIGVWGKKTATGVFGKWREDNSQETQRFKAELHHGVQYTQSDPIGLLGGINAFKYANNNPLTFIDRLGLKCGSWSPFAHEYERPVTEFSFMGFDRHPIGLFTNLLPSRRGPQTQGTSICCRVNRGSRYNTSIQPVERHCDCCTSRGELQSSGNLGITISSTDFYRPDGGPCKAIKQYGRELRSKEWLEDFTDWDLMDCYPSTEADGSCSGEYSGA